MEENQNINPFQFINEEQPINVEQNENNIPEEKITEDFVTGLPDWDLTPPYEVVRRVTR